MLTDKGESRGPEEEARLKDGHFSVCAFTRQHGP